MRVPGKFRFLRAGWWLVHLAGISLVYWLGVLARPHLFRLFGWMQ